MPVSRSTRAPDLVPAGLRVGAVMLVLLAAGIAGGLILIPCESFILVRPEPDRKGAVISTANFAAVAGIMLTGPLANLMDAHQRPTTSFAVMGVVPVAAGLMLMPGLHRVHQTG